MTQQSHTLQIKALGVAVLAGMYTFQVGGCTSQEVQVQLANGLRTGLTGVFNIASANLSDQVFDVDD